MADTKITQLSEEASVSNDDLFMIVENASGATKKVQAQNILPSGSVGTVDVADGAITPAKLTSGTGSTWAWQSWTPTWSNFTLGNATLVAKYSQVGKDVRFRISLTLGSTSAVGTTPTFTFPVATVASYVPQAFMAIGVGGVNDTSGGGAIQWIAPTWNTTTTGSFIYIDTSSTIGTELTFTATAPFTWATGDKMFVQGFYEAA